MLAKNVTLHKTRLKSIVRFELNPITERDKMALPKRILDEVKEAAIILEDTDDWMVVKKLLLLQLPPKLRTLFSTRDPKTKEQSLNEFEKELCSKYKKLTGIQLILKQKER